MKISRLCILVGVLLSACVTSYPKFFQEVEETTDKSYGYAAENPVTIKNADLNNSIGSSYYYLSRLRTENGNKLQLIERYSVRNPNYKKPLIGLENRFTGEPLNYGTGPFLDLYILKPENELDTLRIYINPYLKGAVKIPVGLKFENE
jgi:hypothetical protein